MIRISRSFYCLSGDSAMKTLARHRPGPPILESTMRKAFRPRAIALLLAAAVLTSGADAALLARDLSSVGDGLVTLDTATGLQWLDLGLSVPWRIDAPSAYLADGWSVASLGQVQTLVGNQFGSSTTNGTRIPVNQADAQAFMDQFGTTYSTGSTVLSWGRFQSSVPGNAGWAIVGYDAGTWHYRIDDVAWGESAPHSFSGIFYVRAAPAPEPVLMTGQGVPSDHAALAGGTVIDFEANASGEAAANFDYAGVRMTGNNLLRITDAFDNQFNVTGNSLALTTNDRTQEIEFAFAAPVDAFGFNFGGTNATWHLVAYGAGDAVLGELDLPQIDVANDGDWRGIAAPGIVSARLYNTAFDIGADSGSLDYILLDNFTYQAAAVPEPEAYALMLAGLCLVGLIAHRREPRFGG